MCEPFEHSRQASVGRAENHPALQALQCVAEKAPKTAFSLLAEGQEAANEPAGQSWQALPTCEEYVPATQRLQ